MPSSTYYADHLVISYVKSPSLSDIFLNHIFFFKSPSYPRLHSILFRQVTTHSFLNIFAPFQSFALIPLGVQLRFPILVSDIFVLANLQAVRFTQTVYSYLPGIDLRRRSPCSAISVLHQIFNFSGNSYLFIIFICRSPERNQSGFLPCYFYLKSDPSLRGSGSGFIYEASFEVLHSILLVISELL